MCQVPTAILWGAQVEQLPSLMVSSRHQMHSAYLGTGNKLFLAQSSGGLDVLWLPIIPSVFTSNPLCIDGFKLTTVSDPHQKQYPVLSSFLCAASFQVLWSEEQGLGCLLPAALPRDPSVYFLKSFLSLLRSNF